MRRSSNQNSPSKNAADLMSTISSAAENNARVRNNTLSIKDKVESARRHLKSHQRQFHTGEDSSSGESVENRSPHHHPHRSHSSPRDSRTTVKSRSKEKHTPSVLYSAELQHARRISGETKKKNIPVKGTTTRVSPSKSISPTRHDASFRDQSLLDMTVTTSPRRRSTYLVANRRDSYRGDATFTANRRETFTIDRRDDTTVSHDETIIAPGLLEDEYHPRKQRTYSHGSISAFHAKCIPKDAHSHEVSNIGKWDVEFLPGSMINARKVEKDRRSAAVDILTPNAEAIRYQEERTRREEEELKRIVREQTNGRSTKEIFDSWIPLDEERRKRKGGHQQEETSAKKSTRRLWDLENNEELGGVLDRMGKEREERRVVMEDEAGYAMPLQRDRVIDRPFLRTPSPSLPIHQSSPDEQFFTPIAPTPRLSRISGISERKEDGETPILGRQSTRLSSTFLLDRSDIMDRSVRRLRGGSDEANRSVGTSFEATPDRRDESIEGRGERSLGEYATPIGRRDGRRRDDQENSFLNASTSSHNRSRLNESANAFERSLNRSLDNLSSLASRLSSQLETSKANLSALAAPSTLTPLRERGRLDGVAGDRRLGMDASILESLPPMREERNSTGGDELRKLMPHSTERDHRSSLPDQNREEESRQEEIIQRITSPIPRPRSTIPSSHLHPSSSSIPISSVHGLASLLDANIGRMERNEEYEREAQRLEGVVREINQTATKVENAVKEKPLPSLPSSTTPPIPLPRSYLPSPLSIPPSIPHPSPRTFSDLRNTSQSTHPVHQLAIETAGGRDELMEMYEARHRNWHRRGDDIAVNSPRSADSRSPSPNLPPSPWNPSEWRERQSVQGMLDQRAKAVRGAFLHLLQRLYRARHERRYEDKERFRGDAAKEEEFAKEQEREVDSFKREANEAKMKAIDPSIKYRDFMQWLKDESERIEKEIVCEVETRERRRYERKKKEGMMDESLLDSSRLAEANKQLDERARKALKARNAAHKHVEKREEVRRLENEARKAVAFAEIPSSARSSIDDASFLLHQSMRRYSIGNEPLRVTSARGGVSAETSFNQSRDGRSLDESRLNNGDTMSTGGDRRRMSEMKEKLEEKRRQAEEVRRAMEDSQRRMNETEMVSVAAQLAAHDEYIEQVENVGRIIAQNVQPRSPTNLPPGIEPLDLSSLDDEKGEEEERKSDNNSVEKSTDISGKKGDHRSSSPSHDSLTPIHPSSIPSSSSSTKQSSHSSQSRSTTSSTSSSTSSNKTLRATEELSQMLEEIKLDEEKKKENIVDVEKEERDDTVFSPLPEGRNDELDRSLPSTAASTGRQELTLHTVSSIDTVPIPETTVLPVEVLSTPVETTQAVDTVEDTVFEEESIPEDIMEETVERSTVPSRALFSPIESSTTHSEESESSSDRRGATSVGGKNTVDKKKESIEESTESSEDTEEEKVLDVSTASLKKAISVASEMANPFDGFESSSGGSRKSEENKKEEKEIAATSTIITATTSPDRSTVVDTSLIVQRDEEEKEEDEISWGNGSGLEVGGGSARSADFDWGVSVDEKVSEVKKEDEKAVEPPILMTEKKEEEETRPIGRFSSLRDRLSKINAEDDEEERKKISSSSSSTATSSSRSSSSKTTSTEKSTSEETEETSDKSSERKDEEEEKTPRVASSISGGLSSASGSIDFDAEVTSSRTPRANQRNRFRLSLNDSLQDSPRGSTLLKSPSIPIPNGRIMGTGSPRITTPTSPHTPRAMMHSAMISPSGAASPEGRRNRFSAVMPISPRSGRRSTSPKNISLSREVSFAQDDSSFGDISRLSAIDLPTNNGGMSNFPPILSSLPPIVSPSLPSLLPSSRPSIGLNRSSIEEGDELDESIYESLMDVKIPVASALSSLPIGHLIEKSKNEEVSPPLTLTARSNSSQYGQYLALFEKESVRPLLVNEVDQIWKIIEKKGFFTKEDREKLAKMDSEMSENDEIASIRKDRNLLIRAVSTEIASDIYSRDERRTKDGKTIPMEIMPLRRLRPPMDKKRLGEAVEKGLLSRGETPIYAIRMKNLGVEFTSLPIEEKILYTELYANEDKIFQPDEERREIVEDLMNL